MAKTQNSAQYGGGSCGRQAGHITEEAVSVWWMSPFTHPFNHQPQQPACCYSLVPTYTRYVPTEALEAPPTTSVDFPWSESRAALVC